MDRNLGQLGGSHSLSQSSNQGRAGKGGVSKVTHIVTGRISHGLLDRRSQFLSGCWLEDTFSS